MNNVNLTKAYGQEINLRYVERYSSFLGSILANLIPKCPKTEIILLVVPTILLQKNKIHMCTQVGERAIPLAKQKMLSLSSYTPTKPANLNIY